MINVFTNAWYALLALGITTIVLHFFLVWRKNLTKRQWKYIDYIWISLTAIGLIGATDNVRSMYEKNQLSYFPGRISFQYNWIFHFLQSGGSSLVCREFAKDVYSPADFDSIVTDYKKACNWSKIMYDKIINTDTASYSPIDTSQFVHLSTKQNIWFRDNVLKAVREYNETIDEYTTRKNKLENSDTRESLLFYTPLLLIFGLSLRITKVSGEIKHEK